MRQDARKSRMGTLFTGLLFLIFAFCAFYTVLIGGQVYENITVRSEKNFTGITALSYVANKVRQNDRSGQIEIREIDGTRVLVLSQEYSGTRYETWIYWKDGEIRELYANPENGLGIADGLSVLECEGLSMALQDGLLELETLGEGGGHLALDLRSGGDPDES